MCGGARRHALLVSSFIFFSSPSQFTGGPRQLAGRRLKWAHANRLVTNNPTALRALLFILIGVRRVGEEKKRR